jgi:hypothetical protein
MEGRELMSDIAARRHAAATNGQLRARLALLPAKTVRPHPPVQPSDRLGGGERTSRDDQH